MIYLVNEKGYKANTNDEEMALRLEEQGFVRLSTKQIFLQKIVINTLLEYAIPLTCAALVFEYLTSRTVTGFVASYLIADAISDFLADLKKWD